MKTICTLFAFALCFCFVGAVHGSKSIPVQVITATEPTTAPAEIVTGVCDFGGCPVAVLRRTEMSLAKTTATVEESSASYRQVTGKLQESVEPETEPPTAPEPVTIAPEAPEEPVWQDGRTVTCWVTAYCGCESCSEGWGSMTATGVYARPNHTIAVDPSVIPYGTKVEINGITYTAEDCGGGVNGYEIDVYCAEHWQTEAWDTGYYTVTIY